MENLAFLADENFPKSSINFLRKKGFTVKSIKEEFPGIDHKKVLSIAKNENLILLTFDRDYSDLIFKENFLLPKSLVHFRLQITKDETDIPAILLFEFIESEKIDLTGKFITVQRDKIRVRPFDE